MHGDIPLKIKLSNYTANGEAYLSYCQQVIWKIMRMPTAKSIYLLYTNEKIRGMGLGWALLLTS